MDHDQEPRVAVLIFHPLLLRRVRGVIAKLGGLGRLLAPLPGGPGFTFEPVQFLNLQLAYGIEIAQARLPPLLLQTL